MGANVPRCLVPEADDHVVGLAGVVGPNPDAGAVRGNLVAEDRPEMRGAESDCAAWRFQHVVEDRRVARVNLFCEAENELCCSVHKSQASDPDHRRACPNVWLPMVKVLNLAPSHVFQKDNGIWWGHSSPLGLHRCAPPCRNPHVPIAEIARHAELAAYERPP